MKKLLSTRRARIIAAAIALAVIVVVGIVIALRPSTYLLTKTPATTSIPRFATNADAVSGWSKVVSDVPSASEIPAQNYTNKAKTCTLLTSTITYPSYFNRRGDLYTSKYALYDQATQRGQLLTAEGVAQVTVIQGGTLQFETGRVSKTSSQNAAWYAARAVDTLYKTPGSAVTSSDTISGSDPNKSIPLLAVLYTCKGSAGSTAEFNTLLKVLSVNLK